MNKKIINYNLNKLRNLAVKNILPHAILLNGNQDQAFMFAENFVRWLFCELKSKNTDANSNNNSEISCSCSPCKILAANNHPDYLLIDLPIDQEIKIDIIRDINDFTNNAPYLANKKILLINNFHNINIQAANAFLKTLEEPPLTTEILFLLITNNCKTLPATILSRVLQFNVFEKIEDNLYEDSQNNNQLAILQDLYDVWVQDNVNLIDIVEKWQKLPKKQLTNCLWSIMTNIIKTAKTGILLEIKQKIPPKVIWQLLDSLNYLNRLIILGHQINWQLFLYNFIMTEITGDNIYGIRARS